MERNNSDVMASNYSMFSITNLADAIHIVMICITAILLIKRIADMNNYYRLRLFVITLILCGAAIIILVGFGSNLLDEPAPECTENHFCLTET